MMLKLTDCLAKILKENDIKNVFGLQGGAVVHIFDSLEKFKFNVTYTNHEQSAGLAAVANAKIENKMGCAVVTTGPACTNVMTGLLAAWQDSVPTIFISGQARSNHTSYGKKVRQVGTQEVNICDIVRPLTKYAVFINKKENFIKELDKAINIANSGRQGPVWLDIALDIQWSLINFKRKKPFKKKINKKIKSKDFVDLYQKSKKPLLVIGYGVRSNTNILKKLHKLINKHKLNYVSTWNAADIFGTGFEKNLGIIGMSGQRGANKAIFDSDLLICLGTHLSIPHTTTLYKDYAKNAKKVIVNIDKDQLNNLNLKFDLKINCDLNYFLDFFIKIKKKNKEFWITDVFKKQNWYTPKITKKPNSDLFINLLTKKIKNKCIIVDGGGTALYSGFQSSYLYNGDRLICSSSISSMGTGLAESIGTSSSKMFKNYLCIIGDGSFLMNIQDIQTIVQKKINMIIVLVNNNGYLAIRNTQKEFLKQKYYGTHPNWGLTMPNFQKVCKSFKINYKKIYRSQNLEKQINDLVKLKKPIVCELIIDENQSSMFKQGYIQKNSNTFVPQPLSEMFPFLKNPIANTNN